MFICEDGAINLAGAIIRQSIDDLLRALILDDKVKEGWMPTYDSGVSKSISGKKKIVKFNAKQTRAYLIDWFKSDEFMDYGCAANLDFNFVVKTLNDEIDEFYEEACRKNAKRKLPVKFRLLKTVKKDISLLNKAA